MWCRAIGRLMTLTLSVLAALLTAHAQPMAKIPRIGILTNTSPLEAPLEAFRQGLRDLGYVEGQSIILEYRFTEGRLERLPELAADLARLQVDVILAEAGVVEAQQATGTIPIVFPAFPDPVGLGRVTSLARPGGNITGVSFQAPELMGKRLELLKEAMPGVTRVAYLWHSAGVVPRALQELETAARALGMQIHPVEVRAPYPFDQAFATMTEMHADALTTHPSGGFLAHRRQIVDLAAQTRLAGIFPDRGFAQAGGLMAYGPSVTANFHRAATYVDKILKGAKPADLPVEQPATYELVLNLKTAKTLGITFPATLLIQADEVIQ